MDKEKLKLVIKEFHESDFPAIIERKIVHIDEKTEKIISLFGPRRSGKTYYFYHLIKNLVDGGIDKTRILYVNFEDERILPFNLDDFENVLEAYYDLYPQNKGKRVFIFLDEVQKIDGWEIAVRRINDKENARIFITGSSSKLLVKEIATSLRGRTISYEMLPFSFEEMLLANGISVDGDIFYSKRRFYAKRVLEEYMKFGGFPEVVLEKNETTKIRILQEYLNAIFFRDLVERFSIQNKVLLKEMMRYLISNVSTIFSLSGFYKLSKEKYGLTKQTIIDYADYLEDVEFAFFVSKYSRSLKEQIRNPRKSYVVDVGFRTASGFYTSEDYGRVAENLVFLKLKHVQMKNPLVETYYWKDEKREVDFVVKEGKSVKQLLQVCWDVTKKETKDREVEGLLKAMEELRLKEGVVVTKDFEKVEKTKGKTITYVPLWKWLLKD
jgi:predicted AAA+ superfamily ATPase